MQVHDIKCMFAHCTALAGEETKFFHRAVKLLQRLNFTFLKSGPYPQAPDPNPVEEFDEFGEPIGSIDCQHPILEPENPIWHEAGWESGGDFAGSFGDGILHDSFYIASCSPMSERFPDFQEALQDRAERFLRLFQFLHPHVKPRFGYIDDTYGIDLTDKEVNNAALKRLYWVTWFGPQYLDKHGKDFFLNAPVYQAKEFEGGVLVRVTERWLDFAKIQPKEALAYLRQKFPRMRANRCII